jgi:hypothetical protein
MQAPGDEYSASAGEPKMQPWACHGSFYVVEVLGPRRQSSHRTPQGHAALGIGYPRQDGSDLKIAPGARTDASRRHLAADPDGLVRVGQQAL